MLNLMSNRTSAFNAFLKCFCAKNMSKGCQGTFDQSQLNVLDQKGGDIGIDNMPVNDRIDIDHYLHHPIAVDRKALLTLSFVSTD